MGKVFEDKENCMKSVWAAALGFKWAMVVLDDRLCVDHRPIQVTDLHPCEVGRVGRLQPRVRIQGAAGQRPVLHLRGSYA